MEIKQEELKKKIERGVATKDLITELYDVAKTNGDKKMMERYKQILANLSEKLPISEDQVSRNKDMNNKRGDTRQQKSLGDTY